MYQYKWNMWQKQCNEVINEHHNRRNRILATAFMFLSTQQEQHDREYWVRSFLQHHKVLGFFYNIYPVICLEEADFREYFRMTRVQLEELLTIVAPKITKQNAIREAIPPAERLCLTIRFLASGDSMTSLSYLFLISLPAVSSIIPETCEAIWLTLKEKELPCNYSPDDWLKIAHEFEQQWNFPHCIGAMDGKHIIIQCPDNAGSEFFNYKHSHSIILLGICDANYNFLFVDVGSFGRRSDGGVFRDSLFGQRFLNKQMNLPSPQPISIGRPPVPYALVGDEAFQLSDFLIRPYPGKGGLDEAKNVFNYRLSRCRRTIENTFGILANRWRILRRPIVTKTTTCERIVLATTILHNWLRRKDVDINEHMPSELTENSNDAIRESLVQDNDDEDNNIINCYGNLSETKLALAIRKEFCRYFNGDGAVYWQFDHC